MMTETSLYSESFYAGQKDLSRSSAEELLPSVIKLVQPRSVIDVGCGVGTWLSVAQEHDLEILGIDGVWVDRAMLQIPPDRFECMDLTKPINIPRRFDLCLSMEVAEHIPPQCSDSFIASLTKLSPTILFSAAVPMQGGVSHVNEQWPDYWQERFAAHGYATVDCFRRKLWNNPRVAFWYAQNAFLYVKEEHLPRLNVCVDDVVKDGPCSMVHPELYSKIVTKYMKCRAASDPSNMALRKAMSIFLTASRCAIQRKLGIRFTKA